MKLVGSKEFAHLASVTPQAVANWQKRYPAFPKPLAVLKMGPVWLHEDAIAWLKATGRL